MSQDVESGHRPSGRWSLWGLFGLILFFGVAGADFAINGREAKRVQSALEQEADEVARPSDVSLVSRSTSSKPRHVNVSLTYHTALTQGDVFNHYDKTLRERGWMPCGGESGVTGARAVYCRGSFAATLTWSGGSSSWNYALEFTWGPRN